MTDRDNEIAGRLRALAASPGDPESMRRGLLWVAGEVQAAEQATRQATQQMAALANRLAALEAREQELTRATAGIDSFRREFLWLSGEVQARGEALSRASGQIEDLTRELAAFRHQAGERIGGLEAGSPGTSPADVRGELDRYAVEATGSADFAQLARAALRSGLLEDAVREMHQELEKVTHEVLASQQTAMAHVAGRTAPLEGALHELRRELDRIADEAATGTQAVRSEVVAQVGTFDQRLQAMEALQGELDGVYRELDRLSGHLSGGDGLLTEVAERLLPLEEALVATRRELLETRGDKGSAGERIEELALLIGESVRRADEVETTVNQRVSEVADVVTLRVVEVADELSLRIEAVAGEVEGVGHRVDVAGERIDLVDDRVDTLGERVNAIDDRLATLGVLTSDIEGMYRELDRVAELTLSRDGALAQIADRTTPLEISVAHLRQELERLAGEVLAAHQATLGQVADRLDAVTERVGPIELLVDQVAELRHELARVSEEAGSAQQAALAATTEQLGLAGRLRTLETLPSDIEGMYRDFERVAEAANTREDRQTEAAERHAAVDAAIEGLRAEVQRMAGESQNTELDLRRRLAGLESLTGDLDSLYRELGRVTALATDHEDRSAAFEVTVAGVRDSLSELRERIEDERIYTTEQVTGLWARMRAVEGVPADIERVSSEVENLAAAVTRAFGDSNEIVDSVGRRVSALEGLPSDLEVVQREIDGLAETARQREEQIAGLRSDLEPLGSALADVRAEIDRVRSDLASFSEAPARLSGFDERLGKLESLPQTVDAALRELAHTSDEVISGHQASLASASVLLQDFNDRLQALEALPADMEGLYAALYRVAESVKALREDAESA
jgi:chromosome segregation ATPase